MCTNHMTQNELSLLTWTAKMWATHCLQMIHVHVSWFIACSLMVDSELRSVEQKLSTNSCHCLEQNNRPVALFFCHLYCPSYQSSPPRTCTSFKLSLQVSIWSVTRNSIIRALILVCKLALNSKKYILWSLSFSSLLNCSTIWILRSFKSKWISNWRWHNLAPNNVNKRTWPCSVTKHWYYHINVILHHYLEW